MANREVLIVDDDKSFRHSIRWALKDQDYTFFEAGTVREAISALNENPNVRVILLDLALPDGSGSEILDHIKEDASKYRVIILTAHDQHLMAEKAVGFSVFNYLPKATELSVQSLRFSIAQAFLSIAHVLMHQQHSPVKIFISYTNPDFDKVSFVYKRLKDNGFYPWIDKIDIRPGHAWDKAIEKSINDCDFYVSCLSDIAVKRLSYFQAETKLALARQDKMKGEPFIIPLIFDNCDMPAEFIDRRIQHITYHPFYDDWWTMLLATLSEKRRVDA